jgi:Interferon-induced transmembrane protein
MSCWRCGSANDEAASTCSNCGAALRAQDTPPPPPPPPPPPGAGQAPGSAAGWGGQGQQWGGQGWSGQPAYPQGAYGANVPNYLVQSILVTLFCCLPAEIVAIVYAAQVNSKQGAGDIAGAMAAAKNAKTWCWVSLGAGLAVFAIYIIVVVAAGVGTDSSAPLLSGLS